MIRFPSDLYLEINQITLMLQFYFRHASKAFCPSLSTEHHTVRFTLWCPSGQSLELQFLFSCLQNNSPVQTGPESASAQWTTRKCACAFRNWNGLESKPKSSVRFFLCPYIRVQLWQSDSWCPPSSLNLTETNIQDIVLEPHWPLIVFIIPYVMTLIIFFYIQQQFAKKIFQGSFYFI